MLSGRAISAWDSSGNSQRRRHFSGIPSPRETVLEAFPPEFLREAASRGDTIANFVSSACASTHPIRLKRLSWWGGE